MLGLVKMHKFPPTRSKYTKHPLGLLRSMIVISDWNSFINTDRDMSNCNLYKDQKIQEVTNASVIFVPVDFSRVIENQRSYIFLYGAGIYWTKFSIINPQTITTDHRFLTGILIPEEKWLNNHFNTEPFFFPPSHNFIASDYLLEFPFASLGDQDDIDGLSKRAFSRGIILTQLVFPFKEPLLLLRKATEGYDEFDSPDSPMRVLMAEFQDHSRINEIVTEKAHTEYERTIPGIQSIKSDLLEIFPEKWKNEIYLKGLRGEVAKVSKDFAFIGASLILK